MAIKDDVPTEYTIVPETRPIWKKRRYQNVALAFWAFIMVHSLRTNLSVAIVSMAEEVTQNMLTEKTAKLRYSTLISNFVVRMGHETTRRCTLEFLLWIHIYSIIRRLDGSKNWRPYSNVH